MGVLIFKGMKCGFLEGDLTLSIDDNGQLQSKAILSTSYDILPIWLKIARDNLDLAATAHNAILTRWNEDPGNQKALLISELTPTVQVIVACATVFDALYQHFKPHAAINPATIKAWQANRTSRAAQIVEVIRRVYRLNNVHTQQMRVAIRETMKLRDLAVHPSHTIRRSLSREDVPVGLDWRFVAYRYSNADQCYSNTLQILKLLRAKGSHLDLANETVGLIFEALTELGLVED